MELVIATISFIVSVLATAIAYYSFRETHKTSIQPMLVFFSEFDETYRNGFFYVKNVGNGPALNILVTGGDHSLNWRKDETVLISTIPSGEKKRLGWIKSKMALVATYTDAYGKEYTSVCVHNRNKISEGNLYPSLEVHVVPEWKLSEDKSTGLMILPPA